MSTPSLVATALWILLGMSVMHCPRDCGNVASFRQNPAYRLRPGVPVYLFDCPNCGRSLPLDEEQELRLAREPVLS